MLNLWKLLYPINCVSCHRPHTYLCSACMRLINFSPRQRCPVCNFVSVNGTAHPRCQRPTYIDGIWAMAQNQGVMKQLIYQLKYKYVSDLNHLLAELMLGHIPQFFRNFDLIIPVPLFSARERWRGFNQAQTLAQQISDHLKIELATHLLARVRPAVPQAQLKSRTQRLGNLDQAFQLARQHRSLIVNKSILLIDDITTTGNTLVQAARPLKKAHAQRVWGWVIAR